MGYDLRTTPFDQYFLGIRLFQKSTKSRWTSVENFKKCVPPRFTSIFWELCCAPPPLVSIFWRLVFLNFKKCVPPRFTSIFWELCCAPPPLVSIFWRFVKIDQIALNLTRGQRAHRRWRLTISCALLLLFWSRIGVSCNRRTWLGVSSLVIPWFLSLGGFTSCHHCYNDLSNKLLFINN